jgi:adenylate cyclase
MPRPSAFVRFRRALPAPAVALAVVALLGLAGVLGRLDRGWFDFLQRRLAPRDLADPGTAIVLIDEQSLTAMGSEQFAWRWPWPRQAFAGLIAGLHRAGAKSIVVDLAFVELSGSEMDEMVLGAVAAGAPEVTLASLDDKLPACWPKEFREQHADLFAVRPRWGLANARPDPDGVYRRYPRDNTLVGAALGRRVEETAVDTGAQLVRWRGTLKDVRARDVPVVPAARFVAAGMTLLSAATEQAPDLEPVALVRAIDVQPVTDEEIFALVRGRTVFLGANAAAAFDYIATPAGSPEPGVLLHWNAWQNFVGGEFLSEPARWTGWLAVFLVVVLVAVAGHDTFGMLRPALAAAGLGAAALGGSAFAFGSGLWLAPALPVAGAAISFTAVAVESFRRERERKREIQGWFGTYVSPAVVKRLVQNPDSLKLGGERRELTVYFADLANFTTLSESMPAEQLVPLVNFVLEDLTEGVLQHGCYLDKYIGDAIMAVFGSPEELDNHALSACRAALDSMRRLARLNERIEHDYGRRLGMRIGINTGDMIVGNVGSEKKKNYTVLGDAVNLASRLEGANKEFHTAILIGPLTARAVAGVLVTRPVAMLRVKGKAQAVEVHELVGEPERLDDAGRRFHTAYAEGFAAFCGRRFDEAVRAFEVAAGLRPDDLLASRYRDEARGLAANAPPADWEPVLKLESK